MSVYKLEIFNTKKAVPYAVNVHKLGKISGKNNSDKTQREL